MKHILILEDDFSYRKMLAEKLSPYGRVFEADCLEEAKKIFDSGHLNFALVDLDLEEKLDGLKFLEYAKSVDSIVLSSHEESEVIKKAFELGASQFLNKWDFDSYLKSVLHEELSYKSSFNVLDYFLTQDKKLEAEIENTVDYFKNSHQPLLIKGETGVGKGMFVKGLCKSLGLSCIHINLSEFSKGTLESELFGHVKGAYTGAHTDKVGLLEKANGGILFLDEIGTLEVGLQRKLLRVLEEKKFYAVGGDKLIESNFRLVTATCDDLEKMISKGEFREDLFFRLCGIEIYFPALRERNDDIELFLEEFNKKNAKKLFFKSSALEFIKILPWKGNYRELFSFLSRLLVKSSGMVKLEDLDLVEGPVLNSCLSTDFQFYIQKKGLGALLNQIEKEAVAWALQKSEGRQNEAMRLLQVSKSLYYRILKEAELSSAS